MLLSEKCPESRPGVTELNFLEKQPAERHKIISWEQKNCCLLPEDLKNFYLMTDGFHLTWSVKLDDTAMPLGSMVINSISNLSHLKESSLYTLPNAPTLADLEADTDEEGDDGQPRKPHFDSRSRIFELDPCNGNGKVCLVYRNVKPDSAAQQAEIWFVDRALYWYYLTDTFTAYYRLMIVHLGLPQWQYIFTKCGLSPQAKQWFNMYRPITFNMNSSHEEACNFMNKLDINKAFKTKAKTPVIKKKIPTHPPASQKGSVSSTSVRSSSQGNSARK
ncbi:tubulin polyglutamylase complex subunit 2 isoform X2 [Protopterus annectens]|uniref:tubulin polyglutamylase complex subunit 2 isoform X2 n=1 Tax=Protopterus annectens TaxID=7888 RepID=UPI001CFB049B|nr:tubulin polyglutamylase complex subunit 2 isoform X2 [Protopterus annectens]